MVAEIRANVVDGYLLKHMIAAGVAWLNTNKNRVNEMNVFPVPDGDTGTNMLLTIDNAYKQIAELDEAHVGIVSQKIARGALTGARGNSGTILSMLLRGFAQELQDKAVMDAQAFAQACQSAVDYAYATVRSVMEPVEGTILTVAREAVASLNEHAEHEKDMKVLLSDMLKAAYQSLEKTPEKLPLLKEAGVVDSGGMGLVYIIEGMQRLIQGEPVSLASDAAAVAAAPTTWQDALIPDDEEGYGYDVQFLMIGTDLDVSRVRKEISAMGWSPLIDGDSELIKVHIHVHDPGEPISYAIRQGVELDDIVVENMQAQYRDYVQAREAREEGAAPVDAHVEDVAVITVGRGDGIVKLLKGYGASYIVEGGQTMNPSTDDFLEAIKALDADKIVILPNNGNIVMAARQAADLTEDKAVVVVPSKTVQQGITALLAYMDMAETGDLEEVYNAMTEYIATVTSGEITTATRTVTINDVQVTDGDYIGLVNGKLIAADGDLLTIMQAILNKAAAHEHELATLYYGDSLTEDDALAMVDDLEGHYGDLEFEVLYGGQPLYPYLISIE